jgi:protein tyrosine phosphatase (PTP) superfamily phosphohydrolase (DUF442 family)
MKNTKPLGNFFYILPRVILLTVFVVYVVFALLSYFDYVERYLFPLHFIQGEVQKIGDNLYIGPYPHFDELKKLKKKTGISVVISLLNTDLPQERALLKREMKIAGRLGLTVYSYPLTYFGLASRHNRIITDDLIEFLKKNPGRGIYIHCYLGRHRVGYVRDRLIKAGLVSPVTFEGGL